MAKNLLNVVLGILGVVILLTFAVGYGLVCVLLGWTPDISFQTWAFLSIGVSVGILVMSISLWRFTRFKEGIHGWILVPGLFLGKLWVQSMEVSSFRNLAVGSLYIGGVLIALACFEMGRSWYMDRDKVKDEETGECP